MGTHWRWPFRRTMRMCARGLSVVVAVLRARITVRFCAICVVAFVGGVLGFDVTNGAERLERHQSLSGLSPIRTATTAATRRRALARAAAREAWLANPAQRAQRLASRTAFRGLSKPAAARLLVADYAQALSEASVNPAMSIAQSATVVRYLNSHSALVKGAHGLEVESSSAPLTVSGSAKAAQPVDLRLRTRADAAEPVTPLKKTAIALNSVNGVSVGSDGLRISPVAVASVPGSLVGGQSVLWSGVATDTDMAATPTLAGAELFALLRSPSSPETLRYRLTLPAGARLVAAEGDAIVVTSGGRTQARIPAPSAHDAQGTSVPVQMRLAGDELVLIVHHRALDVAYPLLVDPEVIITESAEGWTPSVVTPSKKEEEEYSAPIAPAFEVSSGAPLSITAPSGEYATGCCSQYADLVWEKAWPEGMPQAYEAEFQGVSLTAHAENKTEKFIGFAGRLAACNPYGEKHLPVGHEVPPNEPERTFTYKDLSCQEKPSLKLEKGSGHCCEVMTGSAKLQVRAVILMRYLTNSEAEEHETEEAGEENPGEPHRPKCVIGEPVNCGTGNETVSQADLSIGGRGPGLIWTRFYNSQIADKQPTHGPLGYGWTDPYSAYLSTGSGFEGLFPVQSATIHQDNGSTVTFVGSLYSHEWVPARKLTQATLVDEGTGYVYTLPDQTKLYFNSSGAVTSEEDRNGNRITINHESVSESAGRQLKLAYNSEGEIESVTDPMGHVVKYTYEGGNLMSVTEPGESSPRWQFKYNSKHELTEETDGRGHTVKTEYEPFAPYAVRSQTDALERTRKWEILAAEGYPEGYTRKGITEPNGSRTIELFNSEGLPTKVTHAYGTSLESTTAYEYNRSGYLIKTTDPNGHETTYGYNEAGDKTSEKDANGDERKWKYDGTHDVETETTPDGETTTIKRNSKGDPEVIERPAPGSTTQKTTYKYASNGDVESMTNPLEHTWKYEYDSYGDRKAETDPEGNKRTWEYNEDSQETSMVSPRGNVVGGKPSEFTTTIERDAQGRPLVVTEPELDAGMKPANKVQATISGWAQEGRTLSAAAGIWEGALSLTYAYQWEYCNTTGGSCANISGATSATYVVGGTYVGDTLRVVVTATNSAGSAASTSAATAVVSTSVPVFASQFGSKGTGGGQFDYAADDAIDAHGDVWVSDFESNRIEEFSAAGVFIEAVGFGVSNGEAKLEVCTSSCKAGVAGTGNGQFSEPIGIAISGGDLYVADYGNDRVQELNEKAEYVAKFGSKGKGAGQFEAGPVSVAVGAGGNVWAGDLGNSRLNEFSSSGTFIQTVGFGVSNGEAKLQVCTSACKAGIAGSGNGQFEDPEGIVVSGGDLYVVDDGNERVQELTEKGEYVSKFGSKGTGNGEFDEPAWIAIGPVSGNLYVTDWGNNRVQELTPTGTYVTQFGVAGSGNGQFKGPEGIAINPSGDMYVVDNGNNRVEEWEQIPPPPAYSTHFGSKGTSGGQLDYPYGEAVDSHGNVWVSDVENNRIDEFSASGTLCRLWVGGKDGEAEARRAPAPVRLGSRGRATDSSKGLLVLRSIRLRAMFTLVIILQSDRGVYRLAHLSRRSGAKARVADSSPPRRGWLSIPAVTYG